MIADNITKKKKFSDKVYLIFKWKRFIIINFLFVVTITAIVSFMIPNYYKAVSTLMIPKEDNLLNGQLSGLLSSASLLGGMKMGNSGANTDALMGILNSRLLLSEIAIKFKLFDYYEIKNRNYDKLLKILRNDLIADFDENSMLEVSMVHEDPDTSAMIVNYIVSELDTLNIKFNIQQAKSSREFVEIRYNKNIKDLKIAEDSLRVIQEKFGVFSVPEQLVAAIKLTSELEGQVAQKKLLLDSYKRQLGENSPVVRDMEAQINTVTSKLNEIQNGDKLSEKSVVLFPFKKVPQIAQSYYRVYREVEIQNKIMEFILPLYEKAKVDEQKSIPTVIVLDKAFTPQVKYGPKRTMIIAGVSMPFFLILLIMVFHMNNLLEDTSNKNPLEIKEQKVYNSIKKFYRIK